MSVGNMFEVLVAPRLLEFIKNAATIAADLTNVFQSSIYQSTMTTLTW